MTRAGIRERSAVAHAAAREVTEREPRHRPWLGALLVAGAAAALGVAMAGMPREHATLPLIARYALEIAIPRWKLTEPVNEIVYGTRGFDTFGETFLLLAAVVSVVVITRPREPRRGYFGESAAGARTIWRNPMATAANYAENLTPAADLAAYIAARSTAP